MVGWTKRRRRAPEPATDQSPEVDASTERDGATEPAAGAARQQRSSSVVIHAPRADAPSESSDGRWAVRSELTPPTSIAPGPFDQALQAGLVALCQEHPDLLTHAVRAPAPRSPLRPFGVLCGEDAVRHAALGSALFRLNPPGTGLTRAAVRDRRPVWMPSLPNGPTFVRKDLLTRHGVRSGAAFPVSVGSKIAAVVELLFLSELDPDDLPDARVSAVRSTLQAAAADFWTT